MATNFPNSIQDLDATRGTDNQPQNSPNHATHHQLEDDTIEALQAKVGVNNSAVTSSLDYKLTNASSTSPGHKHVANDISDLLPISSSTGVADAGKLVKTNGSGLVDTTFIPFTAPVVRTYLNAASPATWTKPAGLKYVIVEVQAGGGGGGGTIGDDAAGGGGGGGYSRKLIATSTLGATETVTIGAGGAGATNGTGSTGETSSFGTHATATGGAGGTTGTGGAGGVGSSGDVNIYGSGGGAGGGENFPGGTGGASHLGGGAAGTNPGSSIGGITGYVYGGGGSGGNNQSSSGTSTGGTGAAGIVIVTEYYN